MNTALTFDWNGETIDFSSWADDDYGEFHYTTRDGRHDFRFNLIPADILKPHDAWWIPNEVVIFVVEQPSYNGRNNDGHSTHRIKYWHDKRHFISIGRDQDPPTSVPDALKWAIHWAEQTAKYVDTGVEIL